MTSFTTFASAQGSGETPVPAQPTTTQLAVGRAALPHTVTVFDFVDVEPSSNVSPDIAILGGQGLVLVAEMSDDDTDPNVAVTLQGKDEASGTYYELAAANALASTGDIEVIHIAPALSDTDGPAPTDVQVVSALIPRIVRVVATVTGAGSTSSFTVSLTATP